MRKILETLMITIVSIITLSSLALAQQSANVDATLLNGGTCDIQSSATTFPFGPLTPGYPSSAHSTTLTQINGNTAGQVTVSGIDWSTGGETPVTFAAAATKWDPTQTVYASMVNSLSNQGTTGNVGTLQPTGTGSSISLNFAVEVPAHTLAGSYSQTITFEVSC